MKNEEIKYGKEVYFFDDYNVGGHVRIIKGKVTGIYHALPDRVMLIVEGQGAHVNREADALYSSLEDIKEHLEEALVID